MPRIEMNSDMGPMYETKLAMKLYIKHCVGQKPFYSVLNKDWKDEVE